MNFQRSNQFTLRTEITCGKVAHVLLRDEYKIRGINMPLLDFKEIAQANLANGLQDTFEMFARDFFVMLGFQIKEGPDRGQDGGRDLVITEKREGIFGDTEIDWLVSCKHKAHSGSSVMNNDEIDIKGRVETIGAKGFIGFYSTISSSPLGRTLDGLKRYFDVKLFDRELIEKILLENPKGKIIARRYFPISFTKWEEAHPKPANIFSEYEPLSCNCCGRDLLPEGDGIIVYKEDSKNDTYVALLWCCKGECDRILKARYRSMGYVDAGWEDISDILIPGKYLAWNMAILNRLQEGIDKYNENAFNNLKQFILRSAQMVVRNQNEDQIRRLMSLSSIPDFI